MAHLRLLVASLGVNSDLAQFVSRPCHGGRPLYFATGSIVTFSGPGTFSALMPESIRPN